MREHVACTRTCACLPPSVPAPYAYVGATVRSPQVGRREAGDIVGGWLIRLAAIMAVVGFLGYEAVSAGVTAVSVDGSARDVARAAATAYRDSGQSKDAADTAAAVQAEASGVTVESLVIEDDVVVVTVNDRAPTLVIHEIGFLSGLTTPSATARHKWRA